MRATIMAMAAIATLAPAQPGFAQGTTSPSVAPKQQPAPVARRQQRPSDVDAVRLPPSRPTTPAQSDDDADARMNRALNSICRGC